MDKAVINELREKWLDRHRQRNWPHTLSMGYLDLFDMMNTATKDQTQEVLDLATDMYAAFVGAVMMEIEG